MYRSTLMVLILVVSPLCPAGTANAQFGAGAQVPGAASNTVTQFKGELKGFQRGVVLASREDGTDVMIQLPDDLSSFNFVAEAKPAFLQRGMLVRFTGMFGPNGVAQAPIQRVEIFQPLANQKLMGRLRERYVPGVYGERGQQQPLPTAKFSVVGNLIGMTPAGLMMVRAGRVSLQVPLAEDVQFEIRFNNLSLAQEGDTVSVAGFYQPPDDTKIKAESITITTDRVYGEPAAESPKRSTRRRRAETKDGATAAEKSPAADASERSAADGGVSAGEEAAAEKLNNE